MPEKIVLHMDGVECEDGPVAVEVDTRGKNDPAVRAEAIARLAPGARDHVCGVTVERGGKTVELPAR